MSKSKISDETAVEIMPRGGADSTHSGGGDFYAWNGSPESAAKCLSSQWYKAQNGLLEIVKFGAMLDDLSRFLCAEKTGRAGGWGDRDGLQGWIMNHCPQINYKTAMNYLTAARGLRRLARLPEGAPLLLESGEAPAPVAEVLESSNMTGLRAAGTKDAEKAVKDLFARLDAAPQDGVLRECLKRIEDGDLPPRRWLAAYEGLAKTAGENRPPTNYAVIAAKALISLNNALVEHPALIGGEDQDGILRTLAQILADMPSMLREKLAQKLPEGVCIGVAAKKGARG